MSETQYLTSNPHLLELSGDFLYHFGLGVKTHDIPKLFGDVKFVICGGSATRMHLMAKYFYDQLIAVDHFADYLVEPTNISCSERYVIYKTGPVLFINHNIGSSSLTVMLHETFKLLKHAGCKDVTMFRCGTSGGLGIEPGTLVITNRPVNGLLQPEYEQMVMLKRVVRPAVVDEQLASELKAIAQDLGYAHALGATLSCDGFYEEQGRMDGAFCEYSAEDRFRFLTSLSENGVRNIEMEACCFAALTKRAGIRAGILCVTLLNRLRGDQVEVPHDMVVSWERKLADVMLTFVLKRLTQPESQ